MTILQKMQEARDLLIPELEGVLTHAELDYFAVDAMGDGSGVEGAGPASAGAFLGA